ncbi:protein sprouty homolog 2 [Polymixia lowei]
MESRSQNDSDGGGGGRHGWSSSLSGVLRTQLRDDGRPLPGPSPAQDGPPDPGVAAEHAPAVLSLDQIRLTGSSNEYTEGPTVAQRSPAAQRGQQKHDLDTSPSPRTNEQRRRRETREERPNNLRNLLPPARHGAPRSAAGDGVPGSSGAEDSPSSVRISVGSASSVQRLLGGPPVGGEIIRTQPKRADLNSDGLKPPGDAPGPAAATMTAAPAGAAGGLLRKHSRRCEDCGRCRCAECARPRLLPSCWTCGRRCVCSAQSAVEYGTCVCCLKGLFYHCSSDDEDTCADKPFSCTQSHCCVRWTAATLLAALLPCVLCYLPAKGCLAACQSCYDRVSRPGCRCANANLVHCEPVDKPT